jgi:hypothetical protein
MMEYIPLVVGAGMFIGSIFAGIWKGKQEVIKAPEKKEMIAGVLQDNYSMIMMTEQMRANKETMDRLGHSIDNMCNEMERLREYARDITKILETKVRMP